MSGTVQDYGPQEKEALKEIYKQLLSCEPPACTVGIDVKPGSVIVAATATDTRADATPPDAVNASALSASLAASGVASLAAVEVVSVSAPVTTSPMVSTVVMAMPPLPPPPPSPSPLPPTSPLSPTSPPPTGIAEDDGLSAGAIAGITIGVVVSFILILAFIVLLKKRAAPQLTHTTIEIPGKQKAEEKI
jgi:hypothetical protein